MRLILGFGLVSLVAGSLCAQYRNPTPVLTGGFGNVVYPGGTSATMPGIQRFTPNVVYPGGGGPRLNVPFSNSNGMRTGRPHNGNGGAVLMPYAVPVYVGGYGNYYDPNYDPSAAQQQPVQQPGSQQPNVMVIYPPQPAPVIINQNGPGGLAGQPAAAEPPVQSLYMAPSDDTANAPAPDSTPYLLAFKDHSVYSAVAYWVDGDTLHYFTSGNTHNQVSLSLVDRELTERLNKESGKEVKLPALK